MIQRRYFYLLLFISSIGTFSACTSEDSSRPDSNKTSASAPQISEQERLARLKLLDELNSSKLEETAFEGTHNGRDVATTQPVPSSELKLVRKAIYDQQAGVNAFSMLLPSSWTVQGGLTWNYDLYTQVIANFRMLSPDGSTQLQAFPMYPYTWQEGGIPYMAPGANYLGSIVRPEVTDVLEFIKSDVLQPFRSQLSLQLTQREAAPRLQALTEKSYGTGQNIRIIAERLRFSYVENGISFEEDVYCSLVFNFYSILGKRSSQWGADRLFSLRAPAGQLDTLGDLPYRIAESVEVNPKWQAQQKQARELFSARIKQGIQTAGNISRTIAQTGEEIRQMNKESFEYRQRVRDRAQHQFSQAIRDVEDYRSSDGTTYELPSGSERTFVSQGTNEYLQTDDLNYNPNADPSMSQTWEELERAN